MYTLNVICFKCILTIICLIVFFVLIIYEDLFLNIYFFIYYGMMQVFILVSVF